MIRLFVLTLVFLSLFQTCAPSSETSPDLDQFISRSLPGFRLVVDSDYARSLPAKNRGQPKLNEDFNQDGKKDWAVLVINDRLKEYRAYYFLASKSGYEPVLLFTRKWNQLNDGAVRTPLFLKPAGDPGISGRMYNSLRADRPDSIAPEQWARDYERKSALYRSVLAIEIWTGQNHDERDTGIEELAYCSHTWYYEKGALKTFHACD